MSEQNAIYVRGGLGRQDLNLSLKAQELLCQQAAEQAGLQCEPKHVWKDVKAGKPADETELTLVWKAVENG